MQVEGKIQKVAQARALAMGLSKARERIAMLLDEGSFVEIDGLVQADGKPTGVVCGYGAVMGSPVAVFVQDSGEENGAVGAAHAAKVCKVYDFALKTGIPVVGIYDSHGARLSEGTGALAAYGDMLRGANNLSGVVPQLSLVLGTCAGVSAMLACSADFVLMSKDAELYLSAPEGDAGTARLAASSGVAHVVCDSDSAVCDTAKKLLTMLPLNNLAPSPISEFAEPAGDPVSLAMDIGSASGKAVADAVCDGGNTVELLSGFGSAAHTAMATMGGYPCGVVATQGKLDRDACAKIAKFVSVCDAFQVPVITFLNSEGLAAGGPGDICGAIRDTARMAHVYAEATTAKLAVITGAAYGAVYVALAGRAAGSDYTVAWPTAVITALEPRTAVAFLKGDDITAEKSREQVEEEYIDSDASPLTAAAGGYIDDVIAPGLTRPALLSAMDLLSAKRVTKNPKKHGNIPL